MSDDKWSYVLSVSPIAHNSQANSLELAAKVEALLGLDG